MGRLLFVLAACCLIPIAAAAQIQPSPPELQNRIPAPLPPPPQAPVINGPFTEGQDPPAPGLVTPRRLDTQSDRVTRCIQEGANDGLSGRRLDAYTRRCANAN